MKDEEEQLPPDQEESPPRASSEKDVATDSANSQTKVVAHKAKPTVAKKRRKHKPKDFPKRPLSAYNIFFKETRAVMLREQEELVGKDNVDFQLMVKEIAKKWKALSSTDRKRVEKLAKEDLKRYKDEVRTYEEEMVKRNRREREETALKKQQDEEEAAAAVVSEKKSASREQEERERGSTSGATRRDELRDHYHRNMTHGSREDHLLRYHGYGGERRIPPFGGPSAVMSRGELRRNLEDELMYIERVRDVKLRQLAELQADVPAGRLLSSSGVTPGFLGMFPRGGYGDPGLGGLPHHPSRAEGADYSLETSLELVRRERALSSTAGGPNNGVFPGAGSAASTSMLGGGSAAAFPRSHLTAAEFDMLSGRGGPPAYGGMFSPADYGATAVPSPPGSSIDAMGRPNIREEKERMLRQEEDYLMRTLLARRNRADAVRASRERGNHQGSEKGRKVERQPDLPSSTARQKSSSDSPWLTASAPTSSNRSSATSGRRKEKRKSSPRIPADDESGDDEEEEVEHDARIKDWEGEEDLDVYRQHLLRRASGAGAGAGVRGKEEWSSRHPY